MGDLVRPPGLQDEDLLDPDDWDDGLEEYEMLDPFERDTNCPKCLAEAGSFKISYHSGTSDPWCEGNCLDNMRAVGANCEHISARCRECGYLKTMRTADSLN